MTIKILIGGDSWGCGEWGMFDRSDYHLFWNKFYHEVKGVGWPDTAPNYYQRDSLPDWVKEELKSFPFKPNGQGVKHKGLEFYLTTAGYDVVNTSEGASSNNDAVSRIIHAFDNSINLIIFIQTDPLRNLRPYNGFKDQFKTYDQLIEYQNYSLSITYDQLNNIGKPIICLGGCSKLNISFIKNFSNLIPLIPSIPEWLVPDYTMPDIWQSDWWQQIGRQFDIDSLDKLLQNRKMQDSMAKKKYEKYFQPDGSHANRHAWKMVYDYLNNYINENLS
jgi:hypothetical protein